MRERERERERGDKENEENEMRAALASGIDRALARAVKCLKTEIHARSRGILRNLQCGLAVIKKVALDICN